MDFIVKVNDFVNGIVWGVPILVLILATGLFFTIRLGVLPVHAFRIPLQGYDRQSVQKEGREETREGRVDVVPGCDDKCFSHRRIR